MPHAVDSSWNLKDIKRLFIQLKNWTHELTSKLYVAVCCVPAIPRVIFDIV